MSKHRAGDTAGQRDNNDVFIDDVLCDALHLGEDFTQGEDPLAAMLAELAREVNAPMPPTPNLDDLLPEETVPEEVDTTAEVIDLSSRRRGRRVGWLGAGLTGAAAATLVFAGGGALIHSAEPGDPLWGLNEAIFGNHAAVVKLASTLEEADNRGAQGDVQGALKLLEQAKALAQQAGANKPASASKVTTNVVTTAVTIPQPTTVVVTPAPTTVVPPTVTVTTSVVVTPPAKPSATNLAPGIKPTTQAVPLSAIMPTLDNAPRTESAPVEPAPVVVSTEAVGLPEVLGVTQ